MHFLTKPAFAILFLGLTRILASPFPGNGGGYDLSERDAGPGPAPPDILPGRSGVTTDANGDSWANYGDDDLPEHGCHVDRNQAKYPENKGSFGLAAWSEQNRKAALQGVDSAGKQPVAGWPRVKDEKLPAMLDNPDHKGKTTVEYRSGIELGGMKWTTKEPPTRNHPQGQDITYKRPAQFKTEGVLLGELSKTMGDRKAEGKPAKGGVKSNPGWLPLPPPKYMTRAHTMDDSLGISNNDIHGNPLTVTKPGDAPKTKPGASKNVPKAPKQAGSSSAANEASSLANSYPTRRKAAALPDPTSSPPPPPQNPSLRTPEKRRLQDPPPPNPPPPPGTRPQKPLDWQTGPRPSNPQERLPPRPQNAQSGPQKYVPLAGKPVPPPKKSAEEGDKPKDAAPLTTLGDLKMTPKPVDLPVRLAAQNQPPIAPQTPPRINEAPRKEKTASTSGSQAASAPQTPQKPPQPPPARPGAPKKENKPSTFSNQPAPAPQTPQTPQTPPQPPPAPPGAPKKGGKEVG